MPRIAGIDIPPDKQIYVSLSYIYGVGRTNAKVILKEAGIDIHRKAKELTEEELAKIIRVIRKQDPSAPHTVLLVLDATTGQNALTQVGVFKEMVDVSGLVVTKLDGSARGGIVVALAEEYGLPVHAVGVGEQGRLG